MVFAQEKWVVLPENLTKAYPECCSEVVPPLDIVPDVLDHMSWSESLEITYEGGLKVIELLSVTIDHSFYIIHLQGLTHYLIDSPKKVFGHCPVSNYYEMMKALNLIL